MTKFRVRQIKKKYLTKKVYCYKHYDLSLPSRLNEKIDPHFEKKFEVTDFSFKDSIEKEVLNITLTRYKTAKQYFKRS